ncbi:MAG: hypothetical protein ACKVQS_01220 [Fimbriimonadaceae bacterium]
MKRFLDGDNLPQNLLDDLERHLKACTTCQAILNNETNDIEEILDQKVPTSGMAALFGRKQLQPAMAGGFTTTGAGEALMNASYRVQTSQAPGLAVFKNPKVLFLSLALAAVLIVMSTLLKNPSNLLGPKASMAITGYTEPKDEHQESAMTDEHADPKATDEHEAEKPIKTEDPHATEPDSHGTTEEDPHATEATDSHKTEPEKKPEMVNDPRVPGQPTLDQTDLIIAGGKNSTENKTTTQEKSTSTTSHQNTATQKPRPAATPAKKPTTHSTTRTRKPALKTTSKRAPTKPRSKPSSSGITVYDANGKPIKH